MSNKTGEGMSTRAIAPISWSSVGQVHADKVSSGHLAPEPPVNTCAQHELARLTDESAADPRCTVAGCERGDIANSRGMCRMHYQRWWRSRQPECVVDGCGKPDSGGGYCSMHRTRIQRHGSPLVVIPPSERKWPGRKMLRGPEHWNWSGEDASYGAAHRRVRRAKGSAAGYLCTHCLQQASHWAYDHTDPNAHTELVNGSVLAYSLNPDHYMPLCVPCHRQYDRAHRTNRLVSARLEGRLLAAVGALGRTRR